MLPRDYISKFHFPAGQDIRLHLNQPARADGKLYASDGHILIVTHDDTEVSVLEDSKLPSLAKNLLAPIDGRDNWIPVDIPLPSPISCFLCGGIGKLSECEHCEGDGFVLSNDGRKEEQCPKCNGAPYLADVNGYACWKCNGSGESILAIPVGNTHFQRRYLALLQSLPGPVTLAPAPVASDVAFFRFDGGHGALMPCRA